MSKLIFSEEAPRCWKDQFYQYNNLFNGQEWQAMLGKSFNCRSYYGWFSEEEMGIALTIFKIGPFRVGYIGFPSGVTLTGELLGITNIESIKSACQLIKLHLVRLPVSSSTAVRLNIPIKETFITEIHNLKEWQESQIASSVHRNIRKANKFNVQIVDANSSSCSHFIYELYRKTIQRNNGSLRYNQAYFQGLVQMGNGKSNMRCLLAAVGSEVAAFLIVAINGRTAYYLHGGLDYKLQQYRPSDLLFREAIIWAKDKGANSFNMMDSPIDQPSLVQYKEKWGGETRIQGTIDFPMSRIPAKLFKVSLKTFNLLKKMRNIR